MTTCYEFERASECDSGLRTIREYERKGRWHNIELSSVSQFEMNCFQTENSFFVQKHL